MHTVAGLIELGDQQAAMRYALEVSDETAGRAEAIRERVEAPEIAALLLAKTTVAAERGVQLVLSDDSRLAETEVERNSGALDHRQPHRQRDRRRRGWIRAARS